MVRDPRPVIAVLGATGAQGGCVARALLASGRYAVRALTRRPGSAAAQALEQDGAELRYAELDDPDSLRAAIDGARGLFAVTPSGGLHSAEHAFAQALRIAESACEARVGHAVWSTAEDTRRWVPLDDDRLPTLQQRWKVPAFDVKGAANRSFLERGVPTTLLYASPLWDGLLGARTHADGGSATGAGTESAAEPDRIDGPVLQIRRDAAGRRVLVLPMADRPLPGIAAADLGSAVLALFDQPRRWAGRSVGLAGEHLNGAQMALALARALGEPVRHHSPSWVEIAASGRPGAAERANLFRFLHDFNDEFCARRLPALTRELHPDALDFAGWLARHAHRLAIEPRATAPTAAVQRLAA